MQDLWIFFKIGINHVLNFNGYDHVLFLIALTVPYALKDWKRILILVSIFTIGHTLALLLSIFNIVIVKVTFVEFLIPITILITAFYNIFTAGKSSKQGGISFVALVTLTFGVIHGLGFSNYFKSMITGNTIDKLVPTLAFALGIEAAQMIIIGCVLIVSFIMQTLFRFNKRDFTLLMSAFVLGVVVPLIVGNSIWK